MPEGMERMPFRNPITQKGGSKVPLKRNKNHEMKKNVVTWNLEKRRKRHQKTDRDSRIRMLPDALTSFLRPFYFLLLQGRTGEDLTHSDVIESSRARCRLPPCIWAQTAAFPTGQSARHSALSPFSPPPSVFFFKVA